MILLLAALPPPPAFQGDPEAPVVLAPALEAALHGTEAFGPWPDRPWTVRVAEDDAAFDRAVGGFPGRDAAWVGDTLHLRPLERLRRRDMDRILRHELVHRRCEGQALRPWMEEARCLWAETHPRLPDPWPSLPDVETQQALDRALRRGTPEFQRWAYRWLRAWLERRPLPPRSVRASMDLDPWKRAAPVLDAQGPRVTVVWPPERLPRRLNIQGKVLDWNPGARWTFQGCVSFGQGAPVTRLEGVVELRGMERGWRLTWTTTERAWLAAAVEGELGADAPFEAKRALAAILACWARGPGRHRHPRGERCPLTHCAVVRGEAGGETWAAVASAPRLNLNPEFALFCGSKGGVALSPREVWGRGPSHASAAVEVPGDPWATWERVLSREQVEHLKRVVRPGLAPGQRGLWLRASGPYAVEALRLAAGRAYGWTLWPSNACTADLGPDGSLKLRGRGWGHNVGLCLATALHHARQGDSAEVLLEEAFPGCVCPSGDAGAQGGGGGSDGGASSGSSTSCQ